MRQKRNFRGHNIRRSRSCLQGNRDIVYRFYSRKHRDTNVSFQNRSFPQHSYNHPPGQARFQGVRLSFWQDHTVSGRSWLLFYLRSRFCSIFLGIQPGFLCFSESDTSSKCRSLFPSSDNLVSLRIALPMISFSSIT